MKTFNLNFFALLCLLFLTIRCQKEPCCEEPPITVIKYKVGKEYLSNYVFVQLSKDKNTITNYPDKSITNYSAIDYYKEYYLGLPNYGLSTGYIALSLQEYSLAFDTLTKEKIQNLLLEKDPYVEFYSDDNNYLMNHCPECENIDTIWMAQDTFKFHRTIDNDELEKYLTRIK